MAFSAAQAAFLTAVKEFGYDDSWSAESFGEPHELQYLRSARDEYFPALIHHSAGVVKTAFNGAALNSAVRDLIEKTAPGLSLLTDACRRYQDALATAPHSLPHPISHGVTGEKAEQLRRALEQAWNVIPEIDPRVLEGYEHVMDGEPLVARLFRAAQFGNDSRNDSGIREKLEKNIAGESYSHTFRNFPELMEGARQSAANLQLLKPHAEKIAERCLAFYLKQIYRFDADREYGAALEFEESSEKAAGLLRDLESGALSAADAAAKIAGGALGSLRGNHRRFRGDDEERTKALETATHAADFLSFCLKVRDGSWFDREYENITALRQRAETRPALWAVPALH
jgi:hypothetical protein